MRYLLASLLVVSLLSAANVVKIGSPNVQKAVITGTPQLSSTVLSDQPDTIAYDDWNPAWGYSPCAGCMGAVRFTAPAPFELRVVYFDIYNPGGATDSFYVTVYDTLDGTILGGPYGAVFDPGFWSVQFDIDTIDFPPGDFYITEGPQVGWALNTLVFDNGTTEFRSYVDFGSGWENEENGDLCLRAGGHISGDWIDAYSYCLFDDVQKFFMTEGSDVYLEATIKNVGSLPIDADSYSVHFAIVDTFGTNYYSATATGPTIPVGGEVTVPAPTHWTASPAGYYIAYDTVFANSDANSANDVSTMELRPYDETVGNWFQYTDWSAEACFSWVPGNKWATGFLLDCYPADLDTIAIGFGVSPDTIATDVPIELWWGMDSPETLLVSGTIDSVFDGYLHLIYFDPPITVDSGMIFIAYPYYVDPAGNSVCLFQDVTRPIAGGDWCVDVTTFQYYPPDTGSWHEDNSGDWFMWAYFDACQAQAYTCGDVNCSGVVGYDDVTYLAAYLWAGGPAPCSMWAADVNCSGSVGYDDLTYLAAYLWAGGPPPNCCP